jgi:hypothetical protein
VPAWNSPSSRATGKPHPGRCSVGWPNASWRAGGLGHGATRAIDETRAMTRPPPFVQGGSLYGAAEALEEEVEEAQRELGTRLTGSRRTAP